MTVLALDYRRRFRPLPRTGMAVLAASLALAAALGGRYYVLQQRNAELELQAQRLERAHPSAGARRAQEAKAMTTQIAQANQVLREISVPWEALFRAIEQSGGKEVTLLSMEPDRDKHVARIAGEAKNVAAMFNYLRELGKQRVLRGIYLQHHQVQQQDPEKPIRFTIIAGWAEPT